MKRFRRLRTDERMRSFVRENNVSVSDLIYPVFVCDGENVKQEIDSMPDICRYSLDRLGEELDRRGTV